MVSTVPRHLFIYACLVMISASAFQFSSSVSRAGMRKLRLQPSSDVRLFSAGSVYNHLDVEQKWQKHWDDNQTFLTRRRKDHPKKYVLDMFPYPSGAGLHVGHPEGYTATDIMARYWRMKDFDVLHPMGWDSFGLPAEQHAINTGTHPADTTHQNIATFKRQLKSLGFSYDWSRELATTDEGYVKWTQWIFLQLFKKGLASQSEISVNWCPELGTVLANEEIIDGLSERGGHPVVRQPLRQWVLKITHYAEQLEENLDVSSSGAKALEWPEGTLSAQKQWIGKSTGAEIRFPLAAAPAERAKSIDVFTTRPDTLMGVTYVVLAPEHPLVGELTLPEQREQVAVYLKSITGKSDMERTSIGKDRGKTGVFLGSTVLHPLTGEALPVWIADYVLAGYGTGAVMAVPAHDDRDHAFASLFDLPIKQVVANSTNGGNGVSLPFTGEGRMINSGAGLDGKNSTECQKLVVEQLEAKNCGRSVVSYRLRDWVFSRQRYWGEPIPIYFPVEMLTADGSGSPAEDAPHRVLYDQPIPVQENDLPLKLPDMTDFHPGDDPRGCLARAKDWRFFQKDGKWFARETNTMPQWAGSCWYYLRFTDPTNKDAIMSPEAATWLPVDLYVGGQEHAVLHLLYARFWHKVLFDIGVVDHPEPFTKLVHQGMILGSDNEKMSKSRGNVVNPDDIVQEHGADALRLYEMFMGPLEAVKPWQANQLMGVVRFRDKIFNLVRAQVQQGSLQKSCEGELLRDMHKVTKKVSGDIDRLAFNTAISNLMIYVNSLTAAAKDSKSHGLPREAVERLVLLVSPIAPHVAEECWQLLGHKQSLAHHPWPTYKEELCADTRCTISLQVNGKMRGTFEAEGPGAAQADVLSGAMTQARVLAAMGDKQPKRVIFVPGKVLNIIV